MLIVGRGRRLGSFGWLVNLFVFLLIHSLSAPGNKRGLSAPGNKRGLAATREPPAEAAEEVGDLGAAEDGGDVEAVSEDMVGLSPAAGQGRGVAEEAPDAGR